jgi:hypothetical protein
LVLPIPTLWKLQASVRRRITLIAVITFGGSAVLVSFLRLIVLHEFDVNPDFTYTLGKMVIISAVELDVAIMAANAPSMKALWLKYISKKPFQSTTTGGNSSSSYRKESSGDTNNELSTISAKSNRIKKSGHTRVTSVDCGTTPGVGEEQDQRWRNDSKEELFQESSGGITVTSTVGVQSKRDTITSPELLNRQYFQFEKKSAA